MVVIGIKHNYIVSPLSALEATGPPFWAARDLGHLEKLCYGGQGSNFTDFFLIFLATLRRV